MTQTHSIQIDGLPEGFEIDRIIIDPDSKNVLSKDAEVILKKIKLRRIVLEETDHTRDIMDDNEIIAENGVPILVHGDKIWREIKESE